MNKNIPPFYVGEPVEAVDTISGSLIKNGNKYVISDCHYSYCDNGGMFYWYVGVEGFDNKWMRPSIFRSILPPLQTVTFSKIAEENPVSVN